VGNAFYPPFWFLQILLLVYPLAFLLTRFHKPQASVLCFCGGVALYGYIYFQYVDLTVWSVETLPFKTISCVLIFIFGALLAKLRRIEYHGILDVIALCGSIGVIYLHKFAMANGLLFSCQFLQQAMLVPFVYYALKVSRAPSLQRHLAQHPFVLGGISFISSRTIEIYMVHTTIRDGVANLGFAFPVNVFILLAATAVLVVLTEWMSRRLRSWLLSL
jgi:hypothetical protein